MNEQANKGQQEKLPELPKERQTILDVLAFIIYIMISSALIILYHVIEADWSFSLFIGLCGLTIGALIGILATPFSIIEEKRFVQLKTAILSFVSGYLLSKIEPILSAFINNPTQIEEVNVFRFFIFVASGIFGFISIFVYRKYYILKEGAAVNRTQKK